MPTTRLTLGVVPPEACPVCHTTDEYPNRPKVCDNGDWWWICCNPNCNCAYYLPETGDWDPVPTPEEAERIRQEAKAWAESIDFDSIQVTTIRPGEG